MRGRAGGQEIQDVLFGEHLPQSGALSEQRGAYTRVNKGEGGGVRSLSSPVVAGTLAVRSARRSVQLLTHTLTCTGRYAVVLSRAHPNGLSSTSNVAMICGVVLASVEAL